MKYAEDLHQKFDRMEMGISMGMMGGPMSDGGNRTGKLDMRDMRDMDPYGYPRGRDTLPGSMYRGQQGQQGGGMMMGHQAYMPSGSVVYSSAGRGVKGSPADGMMVDWYGQMPQVVYNPHLAGASQEMYDQMALEHMMTQGGGNMGQQRSPYMRPPMPQESSSSSTNVTITITIGNLPYNADLALLHDLFSPYGRIISAQIHDSEPGADPNNAHCGRGRIHMSFLAQAQYATQALNGATIFEGGKPLQVNILGQGAQGGGMGRRR